MTYSRAVPAILRNDARRLLRDRFLLGASAYIVGISIALRWLIPLAQAELLASTGFDIGPHVPMGVSYFIVVNASVLTGMVSGFLLLETREERAISALRVTQVPLWVHLATLGAVAMAAGTVLATLEALVVGVGTPPLGAVVAAAALGSPMGLVFALLLATVASNKVEAFAVMKITSILGLVPVGAYFLPEPWQLLGGVVPVFWGCKLWWVAAAGEGGWAWLLLPGLAVSALWIGVLLWRFQRVAR